MAYVGGWTLLETVRSESRPGVAYEIRRGADGRVYCTCPAWRFSAGHVCKHLTARRGRGLVEPVASPAEVIIRRGQALAAEARQDGTFRAAGSVQPRRAPIEETDDEGGTRG